MSICKNLFKLFVAAMLFGNGSIACADSTPDSFSLWSWTGQPLNVGIILPEVFVSGIDTATTVSVVNGEYRINQGAWTTQNSIVNNGDRVQLQYRTSNIPNTSVTAILTIGGVSAQSTTTTAAATPVPKPTKIAPYEKISMATTLAERQAQANIVVSSDGLSSISLSTFIADTDVVAYMPPLPSKYVNKKISFCVISSMGTRCDSKKRTYKIPSVSQPGRMVHILAGVAKRLGIQFTEPTGNFSKKDLILADLGAKALLESLLGHAIELNPNSSPLKNMKVQSFDDADSIDSFTNEITNMSHDLATKTREISDRLINAAGVISAGVTLVGIVVEAPALVAVGGVAAIAYMVGLGIGTVNGAIFDMAPGLAGLESPSIDTMKPSFDFFLNKVTSKTAEAFVTNYGLDKLGVPQGVSDVVDTALGISDKIAENLNPLNDDGLVGRLNGFINDLQNGTTDIDGYDETQLAPKNVCTPDEINAGGYPKYDYGWFCAMPWR